MAEGTDLTELWVFQKAEELANAIWKLVVDWHSFAKNTVGEQLVRAGDSIGANIAEAFGRFHYGEKLNFLYYARGSLYETRFWLRQAYKRHLIDKTIAAEIAGLLTPLTVAINNFAGSLKTQRRTSALKENTEDYVVNPISTNLSISTNLEAIIFTQEELQCLPNLPDENAS